MKNITEQYLDILSLHQIPVLTENSNGVHLVVEGYHDHIDVYPTTGKWVTRARVGRITGFGVRSLIEHIMSSEPDANEV